MASVCILTLCGLPAAGKTTFATLFSDHIRQLESSCTKESDLAEEQKSSSLRYRVIRIDYDKLIPSEAEAPLQDDTEQYAVIVWVCLNTALHHRLLQTTYRALSRVTTDHDKFELNA